MQFLHTMIRASHLDNTLDFFCNKLGLVEVNRYDSDAGRFTLVFLAAPADVERAHKDQAPLVEITYNWDPETYDSGRNFGHLAYRVDDIYGTCEHLMAQASPTSPYVEKVHCHLGGGVAALQPKTLTAHIHTHSPSKHVRKCDFASK